MKSESAVQFATASRIHIALAVGDLEKSVTFYRTLFGQGPTKTRPGYAKFEVAEPPVNLALNAVGGATGPGNAVAHYGIQVKSIAAVDAAERRLIAAGLATRDEREVTCCFAVQTKVWATDPDGNKWEVYVVTDDDGAHHQSSQSACCPETAAVTDAVRRGDLGAARVAVEKVAANGGCCAPTAAAKSGCCTPAT
jgi:catechol 2,3-dioxygenase-like lactoylglutathione lyase family enzyme